MSSTPPKPTRAGYTSRAMPVPASLSVELPRTAEAPSLARRALADLDERLDPSVLPDVRLLVSELITNSVKYGGDGPVRLEVSASGDRVRAAIIDRGAGFTPVKRGGDLDEVGGWGLHLVERLATEWGTGEGSARVWFEIEVRGRSGASA